MPDGDNPSSIAIYIDDTQYNAEMFTRVEFQSQQIKDIIQVVSFINKLSFPKAMKFICDVVGIDFYYDEKDDAPAFLKFLDFVEHGVVTNSEEEILKPIDEKVLMQYVNLPPQLWLQENISYETLREFEIGVDVFSERITIPIRDQLGTLTGIKGRLLNDDDIQGDKYIYLYPVSKTKILFGLDKAYEYIKQSDSCIIVESEKSVMKLWSHGIKNVVAIGGKSLSKYQAEMLLRLGVKKILLALDKDVTDEELMLIKNELCYPLEFVEVWAIKDEFGFLEPKESPCDNMNNWDLLYESFQYKL